MPPPLALGLCLIFIVVLYAIDIKQRSDVSQALWIPLIWLLIVGSKPVALWLNPGAASVTEADYMSGNPFDRIILILLIVAGAVVLFRRNIDWSQIFKHNLVIILFIWYCIVSIMWSEFPGVAMKRWIKEIGAFVMILVVLTDSNQIQAVKAVIRRCAYILIPLSIVYIKYYDNIGRIFSPWGGAGEYVGVTTSKNMLGNLCLVCGLYFFWNFAATWKKRNMITYKIENYTDLLFLIMIFWLLFTADSLTSTICLISGILVFMGLSIIRKDTRYMGIFLFHIVIIVATLYISLAVMETLISITSRNMTFTDRTILWEDVLAVGTNPLIGTGYESFWLGERLSDLWAKHWWQPNQAHNGYLEIYLNLGLLGLFFLGGIIVFAYRKVRKTLMYDFDFGRFGFAVLVILLAYNVTEAAFKVVSIIWLIFLLAVIDVPQSTQLKLSKLSRL